MRRGHVIASTIGTLVLAIFASMTFLYNIPQGSLRQKLVPVLDLMDPWLSQNWSFFAPDPPSADVGILVRFSSFDHRDESRSFVDITSSGLESTKETLVPPREYRMLTSALDLFLSAEDSLVSFHPAAASFEGRLTARDELVDDMLTSSDTPDETKQAYINARHLMIRATRYFYRKVASKTDDDGDAIQLRLVTYVYPRFEQRRLAETDDFDFRTLPWWRVT